MRESKTIPAGEPFVSSARQVNEKSIMPLSCGIPLGLIVLAAATTPSMITEREPVERYRKSRTSICLRMRAVLHSRSAFPAQLQR